MTIDPASSYTLKRAGLRLIIIAIFAAVQIPTPWGGAMALQIMLGFNALICATVAIYTRESFVSRKLGNWDEAAFLMLLCIGVYFIVFQTTAASPK
jgi:hypothetical protein